MSKGLYGTYAMLSFNSRFAKTLVHRRCIEINKQAIRAWVHSAAQGTYNIPVWSGQARASIQKVGNLVGEQVSLFVAASAQPPRGPGDRSAQGVAKSNARLISVPGRYGFEWNSNVEYLGFNDQNDANAVGFHLTHTPRPWRFRENADRAYQKELDKQLANFDWGGVIGPAFKVTLRNIG